PPAPLPGGPRSPVRRQARGLAGQLAGGGRAPVRLARGPPRARREPPHTEAAAVSELRCAYRSPAPGAASTWLRRRAPAARSAKRNNAGSVTRPVPPPGGPSILGVSHQGHTLSA